MGAPALAMSQAQDVVASGASPAGDVPAPRSVAFRMGARATTAVARTAGAITATPCPSCLWLLTATPCTSLTESRPPTQPHQLSSQTCPTLCHRLPLLSTTPPTSLHCCSVSPCLSNLSAAIFARNLLLRLHFGTCGRRHVPTRIKPSSQKQLLSDIAEEMWWQWRQQRRRATSGWRACMPENGSGKGKGFEEEKDFKG